jgi:glycolate oxidase
MSAFLDEIYAIVGQENVQTAHTDRYCYTYDASFCTVEGDNLPAFIVHPGSALEISRLLQIANREKIPVIPRGAGSNVSGGTIPVKDSMVLVLTRLNRILEIDTRNLIAEVEPGVLTGAFQQEVEKLGLFYPPDPQSLAFSTIGGNVAECAGGPRGVKYGVTRDYVLGLEVVLPSGEIIETGGRTLKNVAGYDLTRLFVGSEGTLGIITRVTLRLIPLPEAKKTMLVVYDQVEKAAETVAAILAAGIVPATLEFLDQVYIRNIEEYAQVGFPVDAEAVLLIEVDGDPIAIDKQAAKINEICMGQGATKIRTAATVEEAAEIWQARRAAFAAVARLKPTIIGEDATVPRTCLPQMVKKIREVSNRYDVTIAVVGHAGDGNLHATFLCDERDKAEMARVEEAISEVIGAALELRGTVTGEHGVGRMKTAFLEQQLSPGSLELMWKIKQATDPNLILNPGVMFREGGK